jgi:sensor histidine kinase regulating citrate/malate metabolism
MSAPRHRHRRLTVSTARDGDRVLIEIGDNSPGIPRGRRPPFLGWPVSHNAQRLGVQLGGAHSVQP